MKRIIPLLVLVFFASAPSVGYAQTAAVTAFRDLVNANGTSQTSDAVPTPYQVMVGISRGCVLDFVDEAIYRNQVERDSMQVDLARLSPVGRIVLFSDSTTAELLLETSTGKEELEIIRFDSAGAAPRTVPSDRVSIVLPSEEIARDVSRKAATAIRACGGTPRTAAVKQRVQRREKAQEDYAAGRDQEAKQLKSMCRSLVLKRLKAPSTAIFDDSEFQVTRYDSTGSVYGVVEAMNELGGRNQSSFLCYFNKAGSTWRQDGDIRINRRG